ncbi:MAG: FlgD immunoglobulin-like domain containing protein [candidate division WOR-3 bacterium]
MASRLCVLLLWAIAQTRAGFGPSVRVDHETRPAWACYHPDIALAPGCNGQLVYVAFENDSVPFLVERSDIAFQRSTDGGLTWLPENVIVRRGNRFACYPDLKVAGDGTIHLVFTDRIDGSNGHICATRSTDGGFTWETPVQVDDNPSRVPVGWARLALDSLGNLFCCWTDNRGGYLRVYADRSTDGGLSWGTDIRVDDDTVSFNCYPPDVYVQPGTNHYLVVAVAPVRQPGGIVLHSHFYRSTDMGLTFSTGFQLDTFSGYCQQPHVVADEGHIITDYTGNGYGNQCVTLARTCFTPADSWSGQVLVTELDTIYSSFTNGAKLAIDQNGTVHTALMIADRRTTIWNIYYTKSTDHGTSWLPREAVDSLPAIQQWDPTIAVDELGYAYIAWQDMRNPKAQIWFATNSQVGISSQEIQRTRAGLCCLPAVFRDYTTILTDAPKVAIYDATGRLVRTLTARHSSAGAGHIWDGTGETGLVLPAGVYLVRAGANSTRVVLLSY